MSNPRRLLPEGFRRTVRSPVATAIDQVGGRRRAQVILLLAGTVALDSADKGAIGALAVPLKASLHIGNAAFGLIVSVVAVTGALATIPVGMLTDRSSRTKLLAASLTLWVVAMFLGGAAQSYLWLIVSRVGLAGVTATASPAIASLLGDLFLPIERARIYGYVLAGELVGTGFGIVVAGEVAAVASWRVALWVLALPAVWLAWEFARLAEPARGGAGRLEPVAGTTAAEKVETARRNLATQHAGGDGSGGDGTAVDRSGGRSPCEGEPQHDRPEGGGPANGGPGADRPGDGRSGGDNERGVGDRDTSAPDRGSRERAGGGHDEREALPLWRAVLYVLSVRTNVILIIASVVGYFFFAGLRTFSFVYVRGEYGISQATATALVPVVGAGAVIGALTSGRVADRLLHSGHPAARVSVAALCPLLTVAALVPALLFPVVALALPLFIVAGFAIGSSNPPIDAARLDVIHHAVWGRAEAVRTMFRTGGEALAPVLFGYLSRHLAGGGIPGLRLTFGIMLLPLLGSGAILWIARRTYPGDAAAVRRRSPSDREASAAR